MPTVEVLGGRLGASLTRSKSKIKQERAIAIWRQGERLFRRKIEDLEAEIEDMKTQRDSMLDLSPTDSTSLVLAVDFNAEDFYDAHIKLALRIRESSIKLEEARKLYEDMYVTIPADPVIANS